MNKNCRAIAKITKKHDNKENKIVKKVMFEDSNIEETQESSSPMKTTAAIGADPNMSKGPRDEILLWVECHLESASN